MLSYQALFQNRGRVAVVERSDPTEPWIPGARFTRPRPPMTTTRHLKQNLERVSVSATVFSSLDAVIYSAEDVRLARIAAWGNEGS